MTKLGVALKFLPFTCSRRKEKKRDKEGAVVDAPAAEDAAKVAHREEDSVATVARAVPAEAAQVAQDPAAANRVRVEELAVAEVQVNELELVESKLRREQFRAELDSNEVDSALARIGDEQHIRTELADVERALRERHDAVGRKESERLLLKGQLEMLGLIMGAVKCHDGSRVFSAAQECEAKLDALYDQLIALRADEAALEAEAGRRRALFDEKRRLEARLGRLQDARNRLTTERAAKQEELERARTSRDDLKAQLAELERPPSAGEHEEAGERQEPSTTSTGPQSRVTKRKASSFVHWLSVFKGSGDGGDKCRKQLTST